MKPIKTRYGATVNTSIQLTSTGLVEATLYVGKPGEAPVITKSAPFTDGVAYLSLAPVDTRIPLGEYKYQINVEYSDGSIEKYPEPQADCEDEDALPSFIVVEALDETEVV